MPTHPAFAPRWQDPGLTLQGSPLEAYNSQSHMSDIDPLLGTGWDTFFDRIGAKSPEGAHIRGGSFATSPKPVGQQIAAPAQVGNPSAPGRSDFDALLKLMFPGA